MRWLLLLACATAGPSAPAQVSAELPQAQRVATQISAELARWCPPSDPASRASFEACRKGLFDNAALRHHLPDYLLWGRQRDPDAALKDQTLTQFGPDVLVGMYFSLFMFNGAHTVEWVEPEQLFRIRLRTAFRNRMPPGMYPYPFWHEARKWALYESANELLLWWNPRKEKLAAAQFTAFGADAPIVAVLPMTRPAFDGKWVWVDEAGTTQPAVTAFDGLFSQANPFLARLDESYKTFALRLRDAQCDKCHVPSNPDGMKKLVLLQSPAHAAAEIDRVLESVRKDKMPRDEIGIEDPLDEATKSALLTAGVRFAELLGAARRWQAR